MGRVAVVVLHYETVKDTRECIDSLLKYIEEDSFHIIVVDNGSRNGRLSKKDYSAIPQIHFIRSETNLGFARGHNLGFQYAKKTLQADIIILANNDLVFRQIEFVHLLHIHENIEIAGPRIISLVDGKNQNPVRTQYHSKKDVIVRKWKYIVLYCLSLFNLDNLFRLFLAKEIEEVPGDAKDIQLHGACLIFGKKYIEKYNGLYDKTFLYGEENILKYISQRDGIKMEYFEDLGVYHKEDSATRATYGEGVRKRSFYYYYNIRSCDILLGLWK